MKVGTLVYATIVMSVLLLQDTVNGVKSAKTKIKKWKDNANIFKKNAMNIGAVDMKNNPKLTEKADEMEGLVEVIQFVVTDSFNNDEFRKFIIQRFLHNYLSQAIKYLKIVETLKKNMDPKSIDKDSQHVEAMTTP